LIISIHQPQYFPWLPYYYKILKADIFIFLDNVQYQKNGMQNRNELKNANGKFWLTVPVKVNLGDKIKDIKISNMNWIKKHIKSIEINYNKSNNYHFFKNEILPILHQDWNYLSQLNSALIKTIIRKYFMCDIEFINQSEIQTHSKGSNLILEICKYFSADIYLSGPGGLNYLDLNLFSNENIEVKILKNFLPSKYPQMYSHLGFINSLSALDFILNVNSKWDKYLKI